jgi:hypothetical protein
VPKIWEYESVSLVRRGIASNASSDKEILNEYGKEGWELVSVVRIPSRAIAGYSYDVIAYLKREKV